MTSRKPRKPPARQTPGGIIHTYQRYDPANFPSPTQPPPDMVSPAFEHMLLYGSTRRLTPEELANAIHLDVSQIAGLGPSLQALIEMLKERKRKILETYTTEQVVPRAAKRYGDRAGRMKPPPRLKRAFDIAVREEQLRDLEHLWYASDDERGPFARQLLGLMDDLGNKYQVDELAGKYDFTGAEDMTIARALEIKEELEAIDRLLKQLEEAAQNGQIAVIDIEELSEFAEPGDMEQLSALQQQIQDYIRELAERQGIESGPDGLNLTPKAYRLFQGKLLEAIFSALQPGRSGRHTGPIVGEGAVETQQTAPYEFGDSVANMDIPGSMINAMIRTGPGLPVRMSSEDMLIHRTRNTPKCASVLLLDMSGSMRHGMMYVNVKRMGLALEGLIRGEFPGDFLQFIEIYSFAKPRHASEVAALMPKPVTTWDPVVRLRADMSNPDISEMQIPPHFTNIQHGLRLARQFLALQDTPNRQVMLITDGLPTAHFEEQVLYLLYPPDERTEQATMREAGACAKEGITINVFMIPSWSQSRHDLQFADRMAKATRGRVLYTSGDDLERYVVWDYLNNRRQVIG